MAHNTDAIHAGYEPDEFMGSINVPIYASTTFAQNAPNDLRGGYEYGRVANPTVDSLARTIAALEGGARGRQARPRLLFRYGSDRPPAARAAAPR